MKSLKMFRCVVNVIVFLSYCALSCCIRDYVVPEPTIELIYPKGFSVKIPHSDGISLFAFHGKINEGMRNLEAGHFSQDIIKKNGDFWIFEDDCTDINVGDKIYFWLFVIKNRLGFRKDDGEYTITDKTPYRTDYFPKTTTRKTYTTNTVEEFWPSTTSNIIYPMNRTNVEHTTKFTNDVSGTSGSNTSSEACKSIIFNITDSLLKLRTEVNSLKDTNEILREISEKHPDSARTLRVEGRIPTNEDALSTVKGIIEQKLLLSIEIVEAKRNKDGSITFKTLNIDDKIEIVKTARDKLKSSRIYLVY